MTPDEIMQVFASVCPDCGGDITHWQIEGHPDHLADNWTASEDTVLVPRESMPRDFTLKDMGTWIQNLLTIVEATCGRVGKSTTWNVQQ